MKTIPDQLQAMKRLWPGFDPYFVTSDSVVWVGSLTVIQCPHNIIVEYGLPKEGASEKWRIFPQVRVLSPQLKPNFAAPEEAPLPHVYFDMDDITFSPLCLFDPTNDEWSHDDLIATTTIPWAAEWLMFYEGWRATGRWLGGGRHMIIDGERQQNELLSPATV